MLLTISENNTIIELIIKGWVDCLLLGSAPMGPVMFHCGSHGLHDSDYVHLYLHSVLSDMWDVDILDDQINRHLLARSGESCSSLLCSLQNGTSGCSIRCSYFIVPKLSVWFKGGPLNLLRGQVNWTDPLVFASGCVAIPLRSVSRSCRYTNRQLQAKFSELIHPFFKSQGRNALCSSLMTDLPWYN